MFIGVEYVLNLDYWPCDDTLCVFNHPFLHKYTFRGGWVSDITIYATFSKYSSKIHL